MKRLLWVLSLAFCISIIFCLPALAQKRKTPRLKEDVPLPADFSIDFQLASVERSRLRAGTKLLVGTELNTVGEAVFRTLVENPTVSSFGVPYRWSFTILDTNQINAHSLPDGEIAVDGGMAKLLGTNGGLWAAVLSHEVSHTARRHAVRRYLYALYVQEQRAYYQMRARNGDNSANWALLGLSIAAPIATAKLSRDLEHDADTQGMMLMARAGYHPDYVFALHHLTRAFTGERSKFAAFFSGHPRWETRDQRSERAYADALAEYNRLWPDPVSSPGGPPPPIAFAGKPHATERKRTKTADIDLPLYCRNSSGPVTIVMHFIKGNRELPALSEEYRDASGNLEFQQKAECFDKDDAAPVVIHLPATLVPVQSRKVQALVSVFDSRGELLERFKAFDVRFPKR